MSDTDEGAAEFDPESRRLCPDDTCTGVIGPDGKCKVCGQESPDGPAPAEAPKPAAKVETEAGEQPLEPASTDEPEDDAEDEAEGGAEAEGDAEAHADTEHDTGNDAAEFDPESRRLCPDDTCIGVIGPDGKCKVCGKESPDGPPPTQGAAPKPAVKAEPKKTARPLPTGKGEAKGFDPNDRLLCSDGCCTGLIGPDGKCKVCGKPYAG